jgi:hypothetical protein
VLEGDDGVGIEEELGIGQCVLTHCEARKEEEELRTQRKPGAPSKNWFPPIWAPIFAAAFTLKNCTTYHFKVICGNTHLFIPARNFTNYRKELNLSSISAELPNRI